MTIAACYVSQEGVVLGADSTTTMYVPGPMRGRFHHFDYGQKIYEVGRDGTLAISMWGLGSMPGVSYRTLIARFADQLETSPPKDTEDAARRWSDLFDRAYREAWAGEIEDIRKLGDATLSPDEVARLQNLRETLSGGFCIGGCCPPERTPCAFEIHYQPDWASPRMDRLQTDRPYFWGFQNPMERLMLGMDSPMMEAILASAHWTGGREELLRIVSRHTLGRPRDLPIREAIDWVHAAIYSTIKTMKFSHLAPACGGPIEVAVITTDRPFRWVFHKSMGEAVAKD